MKLIGEGGCIDGVGATGGGEDEEAILGGEDKARYTRSYETVLDWEKWRLLLLSELERAVPEIQPTVYERRHRGGLCF